MVTSGIGSDCQSPEMPPAGEDAENKMVRCRLNVQGTTLASDNGRL